jgi:hypothetical protein
MRYVSAPAYPAPPAGRCRGRIDLLDDYLVDFFGGQRLGCYGDRPITGGSSPSLHRDGRAADVGWLHDHTDRARQDAFAFLVANASALGLQMVLNYRRTLGTGQISGGRSWRLPRYSGETSPVSSSFSKVGHWLHIETHPTVADDQTPIAQLLTGALPAPRPPAPPIVPAPPLVPPSGGSTVTVTVPTIRRGAKGGWVKKCQAILAANMGQNIAADGDFGSQTDGAVRNVQTFFGLTVDGIVGPQTWTVLFSVAP